jgi:preprotein translocase subunit SecA
MNLMTALFGSQHEKDLKKLLPAVSEINALESWAMSLGAEEYPKKTDEFKKRISEGESLDGILPEAFALAREAARRTLGERPYDVQLMGAIVLHQGKIMEMKTGEGKTLSSVAAAYLNSLAGEGVHVITVNDYLAERDAGWMGPVFSYMGVSVGAILANMDNQARKEAYKKDITYGTNNEFGFDYLRDNMRWDIREKVQRGHHYCIIDEIDSILIDEARTPLIISGPAEDDTKRFREVDRIIGNLEECAKDPQTGDYPDDAEGDYKLDEKSKRVTFTDEGINKIEKLLQNQKSISGSLFDDENFEFLHYVTQAMKAHKLFHRDVDYVVQGGQVQIVDEFTGRILHGRRYSDGLHQAIEAKERINVAKRNKTLATITFQNYFRMYDKISGMTGTADTEAKEFAKIYELEVVVIPTNRPIIRDDQDDIIYLNEADKFTAIRDEIDRVTKLGQPVLVGTVSIEKSELLSNLLTKSGIRHEVLNAKNHAREALIIAEAGSKGAVTIATNMAGRGTDIKLGGNPEYRARKAVGTEASEEEFRKALVREIEKWRKDYEEVKEAGGLYILGTERHESRRIDNQLRGRSGRQGDPGRSRFFISLDDDLMRLFGGENFKSTMSRFGMREGEPIFHPLINKAIERAQTRVEERNYEIRKHLLEYDDVLNEQRKFIYEQRDRILTNENLKLRILETAEEILQGAIDDFESTKQDAVPDVVGFREALKDNFYYEPPFTDEELLETPLETVRERISDDLEADLLDKESKLGEKDFNRFIRYEYLRDIDNRWQDHLENLESLREAVYLRAYGQKNPLLEYKLEGFEIFDTLIQDIRTAIAKKILKVRIHRFDETAPRRGRPTAVQANHRDMGQFSGAAAAMPAGAPAAAASAPTGTRPSGSRSQGQPQKVQVKRAVPKVGRNDPCPCGSGKKYKYCCGRT